MDKICKWIYREESLLRVEALYYLEMPTSFDGLYAWRYVENVSNVDAFRGKMADLTNDKGSLG